MEKISTPPPVIIIKGHLYLELNLETEFDVILAKQAIDRAYKIYSEKKKIDIN